MAKPELSEELRETALSALRGTLNPSAHTDACFELRIIGVKKCTNVCRRIREAIQKLSGDAPPNPDYPEGSPEAALVLNLGHSSNPIAEASTNGDAA